MIQSPYKIIGDDSMKDLLKTNCFDVEETMIIVGSCLERMQPNAFLELKIYLIIFMMYA